MPSLDAGCARFQFRTAAGVWMALCSVLGLAEPPLRAQHRDEAKREGCCSPAATAGRLVDHGCNRGSHVGGVVRAQRKGRRRSVSGQLFTTSKPTECQEMRRGRCRATPELAQAGSPRQALKLEVLRCQSATASNL
ncbi:hypothetical protein B0T14DRAFT_599844 [Immersiella caudata]|uniref:Secreted protein n=1 Tax=Immersiella caudata TaxID=314043 RepID=A0AA39X358_9PEZI|nr:hypothetical protein B0T14DRAFT_599844 [Immersiella caudata]